MQLVCFAQTFDFLSERLRARLHLFETHGLRLTERQLLRLTVTQLIELRRQIAALLLHRMCTRAQLAEHALAIEHLLLLLFDLRLELLEQLAARDDAAIALFTALGVAHPVATTPQTVGSDHRLTRRELCGYGLGLGRAVRDTNAGQPRSEEHTSKLQSLMRISYAAFCLKNKE